MRDTQKGKLVVFRLSWKPPWCKQSPFSFDAPHGQSKLFYIIQISRGISYPVVIMTFSQNVENNCFQRRCIFRGFFLLGGNLGTGAPSQERQTNCIKAKKANCMKFAFCVLNFKRWIFP